MKLQWQNWPPSLPSGLHLLIHCFQCSVLMSGSSQLPEQLGFGYQHEKAHGSACPPSMVLGCYHHILHLCKADPLICCSVWSNTYSILACPHAWIPLSATDRALCPGQRENCMLRWKIPIMLLNFVAVGTGAAIVKDAQNSVFKQWHGKRMRHRRPRTARGLVFCFFWPLTINCPPYDCLII